MEHGGPRERRKGTLYRGLLFQKQEREMLLQAAAGGEFCRAEFCFNGNDFVRLMHESKRGEGLSRGTGRKDCGKEHHVGAGI